MEKSKTRKRIIDNTSVRRSGRDVRRNMGNNTDEFAVKQKLRTSDGPRPVHSNNILNCGFLENKDDFQTHADMERINCESASNGLLENYEVDNSLNRHIHSNKENVTKTREVLSNTIQFVDHSDIKKVINDKLGEYSQLNILDTDQTKRPELNKSVIKASSEQLQQKRNKGPHTSSVIITKESRNVPETNTEVNSDLIDVCYTQIDKTRDVQADEPFDILRDMNALLDNHLTAFGAKLFDMVNDGDINEDDLDEGEELKDAYSNMSGKMDGSPRLLSVEEKWQIIFNEKNRAPIYAVSQYIDYLNQFVDGKLVTPNPKSDVSKKEGIGPVTYLLRKLKLDLKMSYDSFLDEFLKPENKGLELLIKLLKSIQNTGSQQSGSTNMLQLKNYKKTLTDEHDCLLCIKFTLRMKNALVKLLDIPYGLETVSMGLLSTFTKSRGTAIEILTVTLSEEEGFTRTLDCFTFLRLKIGESVRFKSLINMMNAESHQNVIFKVSCLQFLNSLLDCTPNYNYRVFLQLELETAGLDVKQMIERAEGRTGLEFDDLRHELNLWTRKFINVDDVVAKNGLPLQHQQHIIDDLKGQLQVLSKEKEYIERQLTAVSTELRDRIKEIHSRSVSTKDAYTQCESSKPEIRSVGCQCSDFDDFGNPLKTAAVYFGWQEAVENDAMHYHDYQINFKGNGETGESETDHVIKVEDWLRTHCDSPDIDPEPSNASPDENEDAKQYFRRQNSIRLKSRKTDFPGNWKLSQKPLNRFPSRLERKQCHTSNCDRCHVEKRLENSKKSKQPIVQNVSHGLDPGKLRSHKMKVQLESQSSDSAIGGSGERLWNGKSRTMQLLPRAKSEEERLQDLITPDDSASACPEVEPYPDYSSVATRLAKRTNYEDELSEVLREFEGHLSRYDTTPDFVDIAKPREPVPLFETI